ncbi:hypothetical protein ACWIGI_34650 [Nocardia sp. NPDC055321]
MASQQPEVPVRPARTRWQVADLVAGWTLWLAAVVGGVFAVGFTLMVTVLGLCLDTPDCGYAPAVIIIADGVIVAGALIWSLVSIIAAVRDRQAIWPIPILAMTAIAVSTVAVLTIAGYVADR